MNQDLVAFEKLEIDLADLQYAVCALEWLISLFGSWVVQLDGYCSLQGCTTRQGLDAFRGFLRIRASIFGRSFDERCQLLRNAAIVGVVDDVSVRRFDGAL